MICCPTAAELRVALERFDTMDDGDGRRVFLARVADNARALLAREATLGAAAQAAEQARLTALLGVEGDVETLNQRLCDALTSGTLAPRDPAVLAHLRASAIDRIAIDQPAYCGLEALMATRA